LDILVVLAGLINGTKLELIPSPNAAALNLPVTVLEKFKN
jgi:hypothetical protein